MALLLGIDTGGTYTDAVVLDDERDAIVASTKALTTRPDLSIGIGAAIDRVLKASDVAADDIAMVSLSTTLATNALVEGQGGKVALVLIGFDDSELDKAGLRDALGDDPVAFVAGGHGHSGAEVAAFDETTFSAVLETFQGVSGVAIAGRFATRNPDHEVRARDLVRDRLGVPVTCSHELSQALGGPKRALTAVLNARLIGLIDRLIAATETHLRTRDITARLMVVRGDGALISADLARERPIETILSGPAASIAGAQWLTGEQNALVSDIGGTTTDVCLLRDGLPQIDPMGAKVGPYRTMVEAVAMRTFGLGGDSDVTVLDGLAGGLSLGPRRVMPVSLLAQDYGDRVHQTLDKFMALETPPEEATRFVITTSADLPDGLDKREAAVMARLAEGPLPWAAAVQSRVEIPALARLIGRGLAMMCGVTPSDASHVLGRLSEWDGEAARKALTLFAKRRMGSGDRVAEGAERLAQQIIDQLTKQTSEAVLETAFAEEGWDVPADLARHALMKAGLRQHSDVVRLDAGLAMPVIGLGASARSYYGAVGEVLGCRTVLPAEGGVANAVGAVVGQVAIHAEGTVTSGGEGAFLAHLPEGPVQFADKDAALTALRNALTEQAEGKARSAGVEDIRINEGLDLREAAIEAQTMFIEATMRITARGRPRIAK
ncbi:hydantoinase/oxoprolinase N-terminal domain-containing protein [Pseudooctadecabacter jejudonensis]|uniref:Acetophenone carboxylase gamma subunit n=1 Tax=Pseudooctadecabacter jejudonensis TaxID=1391910 RepID=A0A1Y5S516_9RHOB|nr:hydantoinase/oxoprolinase family protein [Pseudooctadecabacter jejudonensis]SLN32300.1 Acetophenone carboxylase gamma subunit [Pseudooctadecabacter jejudonensis]